MSFLNPNSHVARRAPVALVVFMLGFFVGPGSAPGSVAVTAVVVSGPPGAALFIDGKAKGFLPLPDKLVLPAGEHRFRLEHGTRHAESAPLTLPPNRQAELQLTLAGRNLVAVLTIMPAILLALSLRDLPEALRDPLTRTLAVAVNAEHAVLLGRDQQAVLLQPKSALARCLESGDCHEPLAPQGEASYVLSIALAGEAPGDTAALRIRSSLFDLRTRDFGARVEETCAPCTEALLSDRLGKLARRLFLETVSRPRGVLAIVTSPSPARVLLEGRWLGFTPYQQEAFVGARAVEIQLDGYLSQQRTVEIAAGQSARVELTLQRTPSPVAQKRSRPLWRLVTGGVLLGSGVLVAGLGASALAKNGRCQDPSSDVETCSPFYSTLPVGTALVGSGAALLIAGTLMLAIPSRPERSAPSPSASRSAASATIQLAASAQNGTTRVAF
jgi:hypothetical protein